MSSLSLGMFTRINEDFEIRQYKILHALKTALGSFSRNQLYPQLGELVFLYRSLNEMRGRIKSLQDDFPQKLTEINWEKQDFIYEEIFRDEANVDRILELIDWALPQIKNHIDEGVAIFEFVDEHLEVEKVGIIPGYLEEGYIFVPDNSKNGLNLFRYEVSIYASSEDAHRALKTRYIRTVPMDTLHQPPSSIKLKLISDHKDLPNPATYLVHTKLDFPFNETIFPIAKRKFMRFLYT
ncbi:MAG: hypothetical protein WD266_13745 [Balneolales bacterium]